MQRQKTRGAPIVLVHNDSVYKNILVPGTRHVSPRVMAEGEAKAHMTKDDVCCCKLCRLPFWGVKGKIYGVIFCGTEATLNHLHLLQYIDDL